MAKFKFYAVAKGHEPGIFDRWFGVSGAAEQVEDFTGAIFKGFHTRAEAEEWLRLESGGMSDREYNRLVDRLAGGDRTVLKAVEKEAQRRIGG